MNNKYISIKERRELNKKWYHEQMSSKEEMESWDAFLEIKPNVTVCGIK